MKNCFSSICLFIVLLAYCLPLSAQYVTKEIAMEKAYAFMNKNSKSRSDLPKTMKLTLATDRDEFYVFNDEANGGYVVISGDTRMPDVLAYSDNGQYDTNHLPCNMKAWMEEYASQVKYLRAHPEAKATRGTTPERENIAPLLTSAFGQWAPYNNKCPEIYDESDVSRSPTGCVATAMAQIMHYYRWPNQTKAVIPGYTTRTLEIEIPEIPVTKIDWSHILSKYSNNGSYNSSNADAISTLMMLCGASVRMDYKKNSSSASSSRAAEAFYKFFDYDETLIEYVRRGDNTNLWEQIIYEELSNGRPVYYEGSGESGAHAFNVDGYEDGYFHINWGWSGKGSYALMDVTIVDFWEGTNGWEGYTDRHGAIIGIRPASDDYPVRYAVLEDEKITFYYDMEKDHRSGIVMPISNYYLNTDDLWDYKEQITECVIDPSFANYKSRDMEGMFLYWRNLKSIQGLENLNTSMTSTMNRMFTGCNNLTSFDVSGLNTDNVEDMNNMFSGCSSLTSLDLSGFKTDNVEDMRSMFSECPNLTSLDVSGLNTENVTDMSSMFYGCSGLKSLDMSGLKTDNVMDITGMFEGCSGLESLNLSGFKTDNVTSMNFMFEGCSCLKNLDLSGFKTDNVQGMSFMFAGCSGLEDLDLSGFKTDSVTITYRMFYNCDRLSTICVSDLWNMSNVEEAEDMFYGCSRIVGGMGTTYDPNHIGIDYAHVDEGPDNPGYFTYKEPPTSIISPRLYSEGQSVKWYDFGGKQIKNPQKGLNIMRMGNGKSQKVLIK